MQVSHASGRWEAQGQGAGRLGVWRELSSGFAGASFLSPLTAEREGSGLFLFIRTLIASSKTDGLPKLPPPNTI